MTTKASAYRPFDGTDADVAKTGEFELELGPVHYLREDRASYVLAPVTVLNLGIVPGVELVVDSRNQIANLGGAGSGPDSGHRFRTLDQDVFLKLVLRKGSLQEGHSGISVAFEGGPLLPGIHADDGFGASGNVILSQRFSWVTLHLNDILSYTRNDEVDLFESLVIVGGPEEWPVAPVAELYVDHTFGGSTVYSALGGVIWHADDTLDLDVAGRVGHVDDGTPQDEIRLGFTWRIDVWGSKPKKDDGHGLGPRVARFE
ncbi:MAG TPA: hypothetical protein VF407_21915 [Polyangiaceae bacterium]